VETCSTSHGINHFNCQTKTPKARSWQLAHKQGRHMDDAVYNHGLSLQRDEPVLYDLMKLLCMMLEQYKVIKNQSETKTAPYKPFYGQTTKNPILFFFSWISF